MGFWRRKRAVLSANEWRTWLLVSDSLDSLSLEESACLVRQRNESLRGLSCPRANSSVIGTVDGVSRMLQLYISSRIVAQMRICPGWCNGKRSQVNLIEWTETQYVFNHCTKQGFRAEWADMALIWLVFGALRADVMAVSADRLLRPK